MLWEDAEEAAESIRRELGTVPKVAVVLGSGLGPLADRLQDRVVVPYRSIPHFPETTVEGHEGNFVAGTISGTSVLYLQGRFHYYEGHTLEASVFPIRCLSRLGIKTLILTAATGGIRSDLRPGEIVAISDHLNLIGMNPLRGTNDPRFGPRFPDMSEVYSSSLRNLAADVALAMDLYYKEGVYAALPGPSYETPAEIRMLRTLGADLVGMSTVPEAIVARQQGIEVLAFALVTNFAAGLSQTPITHEEVIESGHQALSKLGGWIEGIVQRLGSESELAPGPEPR